MVDAWRGLRADRGVMQLFLVVLIVLPACRNSNFMM
jgi:hypothetical protein